MKITKRQLRRIIKEEKAALIKESPIRNAERMQGTYSNLTMVDAVQSSMSELLAQTDADAFDDLGDEEDASFASEAAITLTVAQAFQSLGMVAQYEALYRTLR